MVCDRKSYFTDFLRIDSKLTLRASDFTDKCSQPSQAECSPLMNQQMALLFERDVSEQSSGLIRGSLCLRNESLHFLLLAVVSGAVRDMTDLSAVVAGRNQQNNKRVTTNCWTCGQLPGTALPRPATAAVCRRHRSKRWRLDNNEQPSELKDAPTFSPGT